MCYNTLMYLFLTIHFCFKRYGDNKLRLCDTDKYSAIDLVRSIIHKQHGMDIFLTGRTINEPVRVI